MTLQDPPREAKMIPPDTQNDHPSGQNDPQDGPKRPQEAPRQAQEASRGAKTLPSPNCRMKIPKKASVSQNLKSQNAKGGRAAVVPLGEVNPPPAAQRRSNGVLDRQHKAQSSSQISILKSQAAF